MQKQKEEKIKEIMKNNIESIEKFSKSIDKNFNNLLVSMTVRSLLEQIKAFEVGDLERTNCFKAITECEINLLAEDMNKAFDPYFEICKMHSKYSDVTLPLPNFGVDDDKVDEKMDYLENICCSIEEVLKEIEYDIDRDLSNIVKALDEFEVFKSGKNREDFKNNVENLLQKSINMLDKMDVLGREIQEEEKPKNEIEFEK